MRPAMKLTQLVLPAFSLAFIAFQASTLQADGHAAHEKKVETVDVNIKGITLKMPKSWQQQRPSSSMRLAQFSMSDPKTKKKADLVLFWFQGGPAGGADANTKRWIGQFKDQGRTVTILEGSCVPAQAGQYLWVELSGTWQKPDGPPFARKTVDAPGSTVINVILKTGKEKPQYIFFKMSGPSALVKSQVKLLKASFEADLKSEKKLPEKFPLGFK